MKFVFLFLCGLLLANKVYAQGGPPMITDDPYTVGDHKWEINIAQLSLLGPSTWLSQKPYFDINYGVGDRIQLKFESGASSVISSAIPYGGAYATAGVRYKFYDDETSGFAVSTYPQYSFYPVYYSRKSDVNMSETSFFLPIELSQKLGKYAINPEIGYMFVNGDVNNWEIGLLFAREMSKSWSLMTEIHAQIPTSNEPNLFILNFGTSYDLNETFTLLGSVGRSVFTAQVIWINYLGLQVHL